MPHTNEDARYDLETLRQVHHEVAASAGAIAMIRDLTDEIAIQLQDLYPLYPHMDYFDNIRTAVSALQKALRVHQHLGAEVFNFTLLGNIAIYRDPAELESDQSEAAE